jgi:hypothetical protein
VDLGVVVIGAAGLASVPVGKLVVVVVVAMLTCVVVVVHLVCVCVRPEARAPHFFQTDLPRVIVAWRDQSKLRARRPLALPRGRLQCESLIVHDTTIYIDIVFV